ncbi:hypothetical protein T01_15045 [Trichinella spiralis]|uniref:Uncharacterized protein n=1 Tax=Trichinella spiralis TaxID=6334 RepID=A0A0V1B7V4_TRISP|nr:hypothetical protein T01_15045 [Trichinella spiralis]
MVNCLAKIAYAKAYFLNMTQLSLATLIEMRGALLLLTLPCNSADVSLIDVVPFSFIYRPWAAEGNKEVQKNNANFEMNSFSNIQHVQSYK